MAWLREARYAGPGADIARKAGVRGTPTVFINGKRFKGRRDCEGFREAIERELEKTVKR